MCRFVILRHKFYTVICFEIKTLKERYPLTIILVCFVPWNILYVTSINNPNVWYEAFKHIVYRFPIYACAFHGHVSDTQRYQLISQLCQRTRESVITTRLLREPLALYSRNHHFLVDIHAAASRENLSVLNY